MVASIEQGRSETDFPRCSWLSVCRTLYWMVCPCSPLLPSSRCTLTTSSLVQQQLFQTSARLSATSAFLRHANRHHLSLNYSNYAQAYEPRRRGGRGSYSQYSHPDSNKTLFFGQSLNFSGRRQQPKLPKRKKIIFFSFGNSVSMIMFSLKN